MSKEKTESEEVSGYQLVNVPTEHVLAVQTPSGDIVSTEQAIVEILNKLDNMEKLIG